MADNMQIVPASDSVRLGALVANSPDDVIARASAVATSLARVIRERKLARKIQGREFVQVEGWATLGAMLGITPREVEVKLIQDHEAEYEAYEAIVELVRADGAVIGRASAICGTDEPTWRSRPRYARRSMATTRATGKAFRLSFSWIVVLAGYEPTPAEEMPNDDDVIDAPPKPINPPPLEKPINWRERLNAAGIEAKALHTVILERGDNAALASRMDTALQDARGVMQKNGSAKIEDIKRAAENLTSLIVEAKNWLQGQSA